MQTKYTVVKEGGKYFVMEYVGLQPLIDTAIWEKRIYNEWRSKYDKAFSNKLPTLPEHSDYWSKLEGKVIGEGEFEKKVIAKTFSNFSGTSQHQYGTTIYAIPQQESQEDLWKEVMRESLNEIQNDGRNINVNPQELFWFTDFINYLQQHFTITRK